MSADQDPDYLWDGSGPVDADVAKLERALGGLKHTGGLDVTKLGAQEPAPSRRRWPWLAAGGALLAAAAAVALWVITRPDPGGMPGKPPLACADEGAGGFRFAVTSGAPMCGGDVVASGWLPVGGAIETGAGDEVRVDVADIGHIQLAPESRLSLVRTSAEEHRLALDRGKLHARVTAPPRLFVIDTPAATAVDLGCEYDLEIGADGASWLRVTSGKVELAGPGRTVVVPMGAEAVSRKGEPPGTPWAIDASPAMRAAIGQVDHGGPGAEEALAKVIDMAGARDTVTLWNLLSIVGPETRGLLFDRITAYVPAPEWVMREDVVKGDAETIEQLRETLEDVWFHPEMLEDLPEPEPEREPEPEPEPEREPKREPGSGTGTGTGTEAAPESAPPPDAGAAGMTWE